MTTQRWYAKEFTSIMKSILVAGAAALCMTLSGVAFAADAAPPPVVDPISAALTEVLTPIGTVVGSVAQPLVVVPVNAVTAVIAPAPPPAPAAPAPVHHRHHRHHRKA